MNLALELSNIEKQVSVLISENIEYKNQLTKAKEIIKQLMYASRDCIAWYCLCDKANQFLKEIKEND